MPDLPVLDAVEQRILGSLLEKQRTVPASYPLTLNALRTACNQTSSRDPVTDYEEATLTEALKGLRQRELVRTVWVEKGARTLKYHQLLDQELSLQPDERALVTLLLLRGAQSPGELKARAERLHGFPDREAVEAVLQRMASLPTPLVRRLERVRGQQDHRWVHLLGPLPVEVAPAVAEATVDREAVLGEGPRARDAKVVAAYDAVAARYADEFGDELDAKPFDRWLLTRTAYLAGDDPVADVGCGPGQITRFLADDGAVVTGVDLSPGMVAEARRRHPDLSFEVGDLARLLRPPAAAGWGAVVAWYSLVHLAPSELGPALAALGRVVVPGGWVALALHTGAAVHHREEWWEHRVDLDFVLHDPEQVRGAVAAAGLEVVEWYVRGPLLGVEVDTDRLYVLARHPR